MKCSKCNKNNTYFNDFRSIWICQDCGATKKEKEYWKLICMECGKETDKLYDLFVPHNCKECSDKIRNEQIAKGKVCSICNKPYIDCFC